MTPLLVILRFDHGNLKPSWDPGAGADINRDGVISIHEREASQIHGYGTEAWKALVNTHGAAPLPTVTRATIEPMRVLWEASGLATICYGNNVPVPEDVQEADGTWPSGYYTAHVHTNRWARIWHEVAGGYSAVVCMHCNAAGPTARHGISGRDHRSDLGKLVQEHVARGLETLPEVASVTRKDFFDDRDHRGADGRWKDARGGNAWLFNGWSVVRRALDNEYEPCPPTHAANLCEPGFLDSIHHASLWTPDGNRRLGEALAGAMVGLQRALPAESDTLDHLLEAR